MFDFRTLLPQTFLHSNIFPTFLDKYNLIDFLQGTILQSLPLICNMVTTKCLSDSLSVLQKELIRINASNQFYRPTIFKKFKLLDNAKLKSLLCEPHDGKQVLDSGYESLRMPVLSIFPESNNLRSVASSSSHHSSEGIRPKIDSLFSATSTTESAESLNQDVCTQSESDDRRQFRDGHDEWMQKFGNDINAKLESMAKIIDGLALQQQHMQRESHQFQQWFYHSQTAQQHYFRQQQPIYHHPFDPFSPHFNPHRQHPLNQQHFQPNFQQHMRPLNEPQFQGLNQPQFPHNNFYRGFPFGQNNQQQQQNQFVVPLLHPLPVQRPFYRDGENASNHGNIYHQHNGVIGQRGVFQQQNQRKLSLDDPKTTVNSFENQCIDPRHFLEGQQRNENDNNTYSNAYESEDSEESPENFIVKLHSPSVLKLQHPEGIFLANAPNNHMIPPNAMTVEQIERKLLLKKVPSQVYEKLESEFVAQVRQLIKGSQSKFHFNEDYQAHVLCGTKVLGDGLNGTVTNGFLQNDRALKEIALKIMKLGLSKIDHNPLVSQGALYETVVTLASNHPNIVTSEMAFFKDDKLTLALELMHTSLRDLLTNAQCLRKPLSVGHVVYIAKEILKAMVYLGDTWNIYHNDIKCANILLGQDGQVKISDFGLARAAGVQSDNMAGTPGWMAPEVANIAKTSNESSDIWSFGMFLIEMIDFDVPFDYADLDEQQLYHAAASVKTPPRFRRKDFPRLLQSMLSKQMLCIDPSQRLTAKQLINVFDDMISLQLLECCTKQEMSEFINTCSVTLTNY